MCRHDLPKIIVIAGTNASGKSSLAVELAKKYNGEIISADSRQIYKGFDLCCGKITKKEMEGVTHHLLDICDIGEPYSVSEYQRDVYSIIPKILEWGRIPFLVGGTGLYISSIVYGYEFKEEIIDLVFRKELEAKPLEELQKMLSPEAVNEFAIELEEKTEEFIPEISIAEVRAEQNVGSTARIQINVERREGL